MFEFNYSDVFEPSSNTKTFWLYTNKRKMTSYGVTRPGLFATVNYDWQVVGFFAIFILEGIATWWAYQEGVAVTAILVSIFVDVVFAILSHLPQKEITRLKNQEMFETESDLVNVRSKLNREQALQRFFYLLILLSAGFKYYWFFSVYEVFDSKALFVLVCYLIGALLHISCTGYAIFTSIFEWRIRKEYREYNKSRRTRHVFDPNNPRPHHFNTAIELKPVEVGRHKIEHNSQGFVLLTNGVLTDKELTEMIARQINPDQQRIVAIEGVRHQYNLI